MFPVFEKYATMYNTVAFAIKNCLETFVKVGILKMSLLTRYNIIQIETENFDFVELKTHEAEEDDSKKVI